jgi:P4 family phage/plasmid primase-like protien
MNTHFEKYEKQNLVIFSVDIRQKQHKNGTFKKEIIYPKDWENFTLSNSFFNPRYNGLSMITGKVNNIIVIDIDNIEHWEDFLEENDEKEPKTAKAISGSGGIHFYFKYSDDLEEIKSTSKCFNSEYDIDIRTNGGNIIIPPTKYYNENLKKEVEYKWERNIFECELLKFPDWMKNLLLKKNKKDKKEKEREKNKEKDKKNLKKDSEKKQEQEKYEKCEKFEKYEIEEEDKNLNYSIKEIEILLDMLNLKRCNNYTDWINIGLCLHNINDKYLLLWEKWSQQSTKYQEGECETNWNKFKKDKDGLKIGSLLMWAKNDNSNLYDEFMKNKKIGSVIKNKYPNENLILGERHIVNSKNSFIYLKNCECLIKGCQHPDMPNSMYIDIVDKYMTIRCRHNDCFGKSYPVNHILMNKNEMNNIFYGDVTIQMNCCQDDDLVEFQQIDIYEDGKLNELVFNSLNGEAYSLAEIIYHYYKDNFIFGENEEWYIYENHKWKNIGKKNANTKLRYMIQPKLKEVYSQLYGYYKENDFDKNKIKSLKQTIKSFDNTTLKNNIMTELIDIYSENKNPKRDFVKKLDANNNLIGFDNGVYDLEKFEFRAGQPNDFITLTTGYNYSEHHTNKYNDLLKFLQDIQPNKEERDYMLTYLSIGLFGNLLELFTILTGCGRNGKSKLIELLSKTFGDYYGSVQSQMFTRPRPDANSPDPGLLSLAKKRIVIASEPEKNSKLNSGFIKFITGRDSTTLRNCHSNDMIDFSPKFLTLLICNDIPDTDDIDNAFSKRLRCINFPTEFVAEPHNANQKKIDVNINQNFDFWKLDFILLLLDYYKKYKETHELKPTENILKWTNQYKEDTDLYLQFLNENTEETKNDKDKIHCATLYAIFKDWFKFNNPNAKIPSNKEFGINLRKYRDVKESVRIGTKVQLGFEGYILKNYNDN